MSNEDRLDNDGRSVNGDRAASGQGGGEANPFRVGEAAFAGDDDQTAIIGTRADTGNREPLWAFGAWEADVAGADEPVASDPYVGLINLGFIKAALRRRKLLWISMAVVGLIAGLGILVALPPAQQATTSLLLASPPGVGPSDAISNDLALMDSQTIAGQVVRRLGLHETPAELLSHYNSTAVTNGVLTVTVKARSADVALREANALATTFLAFQKQLLASQNKLETGYDQQQLKAAQATVDGMRKQLDALKAQTPGGRSSDISSLQYQYNNQVTALTTLQKQITSSEASNQTANAGVIAGSKVLDPATLVKQSRKKQLALYGGGGMVAGLAIGLAIVVIGAIVSDRLRRRDDVARVLGAPVELSTGRIKLRWQRGLAAAQHPDIQRIATHLANAVAHSASGGPANLAVVPVDDERVPAISLASLAVSCAHQGLRTVVADLCDGSPAARMLGVNEPGVREVSVRRASLTVIVPEDDEVPIPGPLSDQTTEQILMACRPAEVLLTLAPVDPALGADYLAGWTTSVVAVVTAGRASAERVFGVGELLRLAGLKSVSAVLLDADKNDESLGVVPGAVPGRHADAGMNSVLARSGSHQPVADANLAGD